MLRQVGKVRFDTIVKSLAEATSAQYIEDSTRKKSMILRQRKWRSSA